MKSKERRIILDADSVRAVLKGRKVQVRRPVSPGWISADCIGFTELSPGRWRQQFEHGGKIWNKAWSNKCPYGKTGDHLWAAEAFTLQCDVDGDPPPFRDGRPVKLDDVGGWLQPHYKATDPEPALSCERLNCREADDPHCHWKSPRVMPRWASRITLEITDVQVECSHDTWVWVLTFERCAPGHGCARTK